MRESPLRPNARSCDALKLTLQSLSTNKAPHKAGHAQRLTAKLSARGCACQPHSNPPNKARMAGPPSAHRQ